MADDLRYRIGIDGSAASRTLGSLQNGIGGLHGALVGLGAIGIFTKVIKDGFEFNQTMHDGELAVAAIIQQFGNLDEAAAKQVAAGAMQKIIDLEPKVAGSLSDLVKGFSSTAAAAAGVGISVDQNIDLVGKFANALGKLEAPIDQVGQELRSILTGNIGADSQLAKTLGITNEMVSAAKDAGQLYELLNSKIGKLGDAGDNAATRFSSLSSAIDKASGALAAGLFDQALDGSVQLTESINQNISAFRDLGTGISVAGKELGKFIGFIHEATKQAGALAATVGLMISDGASYGEAAKTIEAVAEARKKDAAEAEAQAKAAAAALAATPAADFKSPPAKSKGGKSDDQRNKEQQDYTLARNNLLGELAILELQTKGHDRKAKALQRTLNIQREMLDIMRSTGASEESALRLATRKADLEDKLVKRKQRGNDDGTGPGKHIGGVQARHGLSSGGPLAGGGLSEFDRLQQKKETSTKDPALPGFKRGAFVPTFFNSLSDRRSGEDSGVKLLGSGRGQALSQRMAEMTAPAKAAGGKQEDSSASLLGQVVSELKRIRTA